MKPKECVFPECDRKRNARGLCSTHYSYAARRVHRGESTWAKLEAIGLALSRDETLASSCFDREVKAREGAPAS